MSPSKLALCMIIKNEADNLLKLLPQAKKYCDEMVIVDTGSTDDSIRIAKSFGANVSQFEWIDDFAAARNASLSRCQADWILVLDADETLTDQDWEKIRDKVDHEKIEQCYYLRQVNYVKNAASVGLKINDLAVPGYENYPGYIESWLARFFKNNDGIMFSGIVHEHLVDRDGSLVEGQRLAVDIHHTGQVLSSEMMSKKKIMYQQLGEKKAEHTPSFKSYHELGVASWEIGDLAKAQLWFEKANQLKLNDEQNLMALATVLQIQKKFNDAQIVFEKILKHNPEHSQVRLSLGGCLRAAQKWDQSIRYLSDQIQQFPYNDLARSWLCDVYKDARRHNPNRPAKVSACYIVKNEAEILEQSLQSIVGIVYELIVVDTGSSDQTVAIAKKYGAKVYSILWPNDFAQARNESLKHATGEWILVLDADEVLPLSCRDQLREIATRVDFDMVSLVQTTFSDRSTIPGWQANNLHDPEAKNQVGYLESPLVRFFRNTPEIAFSGAVHEHAVSKTQKKEIVASRIRIYHYGKLRSSERMNEKYHLYRDIGEKKLKERPHDAQAYFELAVQSWELGSDRCETEKLFKRAVELQSRQSDYHLAYASFLMEDRNRSADACDQFAAAITIKPDDPELYVYASSLLIEVGRLDVALQFLNHAKAHNGGHLVALHLNEATVFEKLGWHKKADNALASAEAINPMFPAIWVNRALFAKSRKDWIAAELAARHAMNLPGAGLSVHQLLGEILFSMGRRSEAFEIFRNAYNLEPKNSSALWQTLLSAYSIGNNEVTIEFEKKLMLLSENNEEARKRCEELLQIYQTQKDNNAFVRFTKLNNRVGSSSHDNIAAIAMERSI